MKTDNFCNNLNEACPHCHKCDYYYCKDAWINEDYEPSDDEFYESIEREIALSEAIYDNMR